MVTTKEFLKEYLQQEGRAEILNNSFYDQLPAPDVDIVIDNVSHDCVGGVRVGVSVTQQGDDYAEEFQVKILFMDLLTYIYGISKPLEGKMYALETCISDNR